MPTLIESLVTPCESLELLLPRDVAPNVSAASSNVTTQTVSVVRRVVRFVPMDPPRFVYIRSVRPGYEIVPSRERAVRRERTVSTERRANERTHRDHRRWELPVDAQAVGRLREQFGAPRRGTG